MGRKRTVHPTHRLLMMAALVLAVFVSAGCTAGEPEVAQVPPTKTPKPTFTPTPEWTPTPIVFATATPVVPPTPEATATPVPTEVPPSPTPEPAPNFTAEQEVNIRSGPGTSYPKLGSLAAGDSYEILGKNAASDWLQFVYDGDPAWVSADMVTVSGNMGTVEVAQNIPAPPAPTARPVAPRPQPTSPPPPTSPPAPPPSQYEYSQARQVRCDPQAGGTWFDGYVRKGGQPVDGLRVVWSGGGADGAWATEPAITGPHVGYPGWDHGYFSHIVGAPPNPRAGTWAVWVVDGNGKRISEVGSWTSTGPGEGGCNQATLEFNG
jgi:uncharacterized protein YraI